MFKKPFHVKSNAAMKGSDKRKMKTSVLQQFGEITSVQVDSIFPNKSQTTTMKIQTHTGEHMMVYCADGVPAFFENEKVLYPTVYTLWKCPSLLPCLSTYAPVIEKMAGGADLMLPGVVFPETGLPPLEKSQLCSVNVVGNLAPVAIGTASVSSEDMLGRAMKGKGVLTLHCIGDHLWESGGKLKPPQINPISRDSPPPGESAIAAQNSAGSNNNNENMERTEGLESQSAIDGGHVCEGNGEGGGLKEDLVGLSLDAGAVGGEPEPVEDEGDGVSPVDAMDERLYQCLLHSLKKKVKPSDLPLLTSSLYRNYMQTSCPEGKTLDLKKSSYKKLSKFLRAMQERRLLDVRELSRGVDSITAIYKDHDELRSFVPLVDSGDSDEQSDAASSNPSSSSKAPEGPPEIRQFYSVMPNQAPVLQHSGYKRGDWMTKEDVRNAITAYIKNESLIDQNDYSHVMLDPILHDAAIKKSEGSVSHLKWDQLFTRFLHKMNPGYQILFPSDLSAKVQPRIHKGQVQPIILKLERKGGNKWITVIQNLEQFSLDPKEFGHRLQIAFNNTFTPFALLYCFSKRHSVDHSDPELGAVQSGPQGVWPSAPDSCCSQYYSG
ncbi:eukaryotic translation initiation factor 2D isoform X2 [Strongylocentrotus purpuratus]|nr:eukaryotic translation initiation factor 2D isoform X2 [Strongylocentrotus purpuratus]